MTMTTQAPPQPGSTLFVPVLSSRWALRVEHLVLTAVLAAMFLVLNHMPLRNTDLWGHVLYGQWIVEHATLPTVDPFMPLAEGVPVVDYAWLAQVALAQVESLCGPQGLANLYTLLIWGSFVVLARAFYLQSGRISLALVGVLCTLVVGWSRVTTIRPENFAVLLFAVLLWLLVGARWRKKGPARWPLSLWIGVPLLFALWANLHGSFLCGLAVLGCCWLGSMLEVAWRERSAWAVLGDKDTRRWLVLGELAAAATLLNPYGMDLLVWTLRFSAHENLVDIAEWQPLVLLGTGGVEFCLAAVALFFVLRHSRRRVTAAEVLLLLVFAGLAVARVRMMGWLAPLVSLVLVPHLDDIASRLWPRKTHRDALADEPLAEGQLPPGRSFRYSIVCAVVVWLAFAFSGFSAPLLGEGARDQADLYAQDTPRALSAWLRENPSEGIVFAPQWWADWLVWDGPPGFQPMVSTNMHLVPRQVWEDYRRITMAQGPWENVLGRYHTNMLIIDRQLQPLLAGAVRNNANWIPRYEDDDVLVVSRARPASAAVVATCH